MVAFAVVLILLVYVLLMVWIVRLNWLLYQKGEALAEARHRETRASMIVSDLVEDERRRLRAEEREVIDFLA